jgi:hypothetical protein
MKVKYKIPVIDYVEGEIELNEIEEKYFKRQMFDYTLVEIAERIYEDPVTPLSGALELGYAYIKEIDKEKVTLDDVKGVD